MNSELYQRIMDEYRLRREKDLQAEEARRREVFSAHPEIGALWDKRHALILDGLGGILSGGERDLEQVMEEYNARIGNALAAAGYPRDHLSPVFRCPLCRDTGLVGDPIKTECVCFKRRAREILQQEALAKEGPESFDTFDLRVFPDEPLKEYPDLTQRGLMEIICNKCREFAEAYPDGPYKNLVLHGNTGLGKTWLLKCVARRLRERDVDTLYTTAYRLLDDLRADYFRPGSRDTSPYFICDMLLIDDLGMEPLFENVTLEVFFNVLNERTLAGLGTCVSTNLSLTELKNRYTERFTSRLLDRRSSLNAGVLGTDLRTGKN